MTAEELLARASCSWDDSMFHHERTDDYPCTDCRNRAAAQVAALREAGLLPDPVETVEWGTSVGASEDQPRQVPSEAFAREYERYGHRAFRRTRCSWPADQVGEWEPVEES